MQGWMAQLSNGEIRYETPPEPGQRTSWQQFLEYLRDNPTYTDEKDVEKPLRITRLSLVRGESEAISLPPKLCDGYFQAYESHYSWFGRKNFLSLQGIGSIIGDQVYITWLTLDGKQSRQDVRPLDSCKIHTTLQ